MKPFLMALVLLFVILPATQASILIVGEEEMFKQAEAIAIVDIQQLTSADVSRMSPLTAKAFVQKSYKGDLKETIEFEIPRFFPCAVFDVSTGRHLVFLKKAGGVWQGCNWHLSYIYLNAPKVSWFSADGEFKREACSAQDVLAVVEKRTSPSAADTGGGASRMR